MDIYTPDQVVCFRALGDITRLRIMRLLAVSGDEACLCELGISLQEPGYKLSRHLKILRDAGLLKAEKEGRWVYHRAATTPDVLIHLQELIKALPDSTGVYERDLERFEERKRCRVGDRCRGDAQENGDQEDVQHKGTMASGKR